MSKESREKVWKATAEKKPIKSFDDDIANLNNDDSFIPINEEEEERKPLTEEEKQEVRKKLFILLIVIIAVLILLIVVLIFDPFNSNNKKETKENPTEEVEETEEPETYKSLNQLDDGSIAIDNEEIQILSKEITYRQYEYYENDTIALYTSNSVNISSLSNKNKLFLVSKTSDFNSLVKKLITNDSICDSNLTIEFTAVDNILKNRLGTTVTAYEDFIYSYYEDDSYVKTIKFTKNDNNYVGTCYKPNENVTTLSQQVVTAATKESNKLYIDCKVVFIKKDGVYKDPTFKTLITNDQNKLLADYINEGNTYRYTYDISSSNYYLTNVSLLK